MKASELVTYVNKLIEEHGDLRIDVMSWGNQFKPATGVNAFDADGMPLCEGDDPTNFTIFGD